MGTILFRRRKASQSLDPLSKFWLNDVMDLQALSNTPDSQRNAQWEDQFLTALSQENVSLLSPDPQEGPDGWPYLFATTKGVDLLGQTASAEEPFQKIIQWASTRGIGLAVNPQKEFPDFILTYGMVWSFRETGKFIDRSNKEDQARTEKVEMNKTDLKHAGTPNDKYLPPYVRTILKSFFRDQGVFTARVLLVSQDAQNYDLAFSADSLGRPPEAEWSGIAEAISWFLPPHYSLMIVGEEGLPPFTDL